MGPNLLLLVAHVFLAVSCITTRVVEARYHQNPDTCIDSQATNIDDSNEIADAVPVELLVGSRPSAQYQNDIFSETRLRQPVNGFYKNNKRDDDRGKDAKPYNNEAVLNRFRDQCGEAPLNLLTKDPKRNRIIHGDNQTYGEWPSFVEIVASRSPPRVQSICSGTLVSDRHVLTAAHCLDLRVSNTTIVPAHPSDLHLTLGSHWINLPDKYEQIRRARSLCVASKYEHTFAAKPNDWALIELDKPVDLNMYVQPACLPFGPIETRGRRSECWMVGAGLSLTHPHPVRPDIVRKVRAEQVPCAPHIIPHATRQCFANFNEKVGNICPGDSGGPLLCLDDGSRWTVVGVASASFNCSEANPPEQDLRFGAVYTSVVSVLHDMVTQCK